jgi:hypothetical protein
MRAVRMRVAALAAATLLLPACGPRAIAVGSRPFPAARPVFSDASGNPLADLPPSSEPVRLLLLEFPWCPACADVWRSVRSASAPFPAGTVRVYRLLFDRETSVSRDGVRQVPPLHPAPLPGRDAPGKPGGPEVTTLTAIPAEFRKEFRLSQGPVLLLLDAGGKVERRWIGYSAGMSRELSSEIRKRSPAPSPRLPGT